MFTASHSAVLLDRQPLWLEAVEIVLRRIDVRVAGKATTPTEALALVGQHRPDIFVTSIEMGDDEMSGIECIARARELVPNLRPVVLSAHTEPEFIDRALDAGAVAYVIKTRASGRSCVGDPPGVPALGVLRRLAAARAGAWQAPTREPTSSRT